MAKELKGLKTEKKINPKTITLETKLIIRNSTKINKEVKKQFGLNINTLGFSSAKLEQELFVRDILIEKILNKEVVLDT